MKSYPRLAATLLLSFQFGLALQPAHESAASPVSSAIPGQTAPAPDLKSVTDALKLRGDMADSVGSGTETSAAAVTRLKAQAAASGLQIDSAADFAYAAIDVGQRLLAAGKPAAAEGFFQAAEQSLDGLVKRTADTQAKDKAQYLRKLSFIRGNYLNNAAQAKLDIEQALALQPNDKGLQRARQALANSHAPITAMNPKG
jgi:hypothetical protein